VGSIAQVDDNRLTIASDGGAVATFEWIGPPLSAQFSVGDAVTAQGGQSSSAWSVVKSARATAAIYAMYSSTLPIVPGQVPGGPSYVLAPSCITTTRCDQPFVVATTYQRLTASSGNESAVIEPGATGQVGGWRMTNVLSTQQRCFGSCTVVDPESWHVVSALGPP
jgi:hypothetical protein